MCVKILYLALTLKSEDCKFVFSKVSNVFYNILEAQLLSNYEDVTDLLRISIKGRLAVLVISPLFVVRFCRSLRFCHLVFDF